MKDNEKNLRRNPFIVPEGYFEQLEKSIQNSVSSPAKPSHSVLWPGLALAASLALAVFLIWPINKPQSTEDILASVSEEQLMMYIQEAEALATEDVLQPSEILSWNEEFPVIDSL